MELGPFVVRLIAGIFGVLAALTLIIVAIKATRETREALDRRRRSRLEPVIHEYTRSAGSRPIRSYLPVPLSRRDRRVAEAVLLEAARGMQDEARDRITAAFEALGSVRAAIRSLRSGRWWASAEAAERLGLMRSRAAIEPLVGRLADEAGEVRMRAARALGLIRGGTSIRPLVTALADPSRWSAIRVAEILIGVGVEAVDEVLLAYDGLPVHARITALDVLGRIRSHRARDLMVRCLADQHPDIRARAAHGLGLIGDPAAAQGLVRALRDPEWPVRAMAAKALGRSGTIPAIPALCEALADRQWWVRANAGEALRRLGRAGQEALIRMLDASDTYARHQAVEQLEEAGVIDAHVSDLGSANPARREAAARLVEKIISVQRVDRLSQQAGDHAEEAVRLALTQALMRPPAVPRREAR